MVFEKNISKIEAVIGYTFRDKSLLRQAFTRTSYCNEHRSAGQSNEVLEFFGDSILSASIVTLFMREFSHRVEKGIRTDFKEGDFTVIRSKLSDKKNLSDKIKATGLQRFLLLGEGDSKLGVADEPSVMEDLFESIIGAIYIDCDMNMETVIGVVASLLDIKEVLASKASSKSAPAQSAKNRLQEWCADKSRRLPPPIYKTVSESGPEHKKVYERACYIGDKLYGVGSGKNQKAADSDAAEKTLEMLIAEEKRASAPQADLQAVARLKEYAKSKKLGSPTFRDLGETENSKEGAREYEVMCSFKDLKATATASDKNSARALAAEKILNIILKPKKESEPQKKQKVAPRVTKNTSHGKPSRIMKKQGSSLKTKKNTRIT
ncbi:MAG: hypothetical protein IJ515_05515 [Clostridia bacterium]|nr:hypothetical protein [Clostridia bacterium]